MFPKYLLPSFGLIRLTVREQMSLEDFQDSRHGGHLGYWSETSLAILNLYVALMAPIKFQPNLTIWEISVEEFQDGRHAAILDIGTEWF